MKRWSQFDPADPGVHAVVVDSIGLLSRVYRHADIAVVGGGFRGALHNILEATVYGLPVIFGPETARYWEAQAAVEAGCSFQVKDAGSFSAALLHFLEEKPAREAAGLAAKAFIGRNSGATQLICKHFIPSAGAGGNEL
jgi:3-deoxy-D-manno-octulosonic-acid transferase